MCYPESEEFEEQVVPSTPDVVVLSVAKLKERFAAAKQYKSPQRYSLFVANAQEIIGALALDLDV
jgi:hypothetical protein